MSSPSLIDYFAEKIFSYSTKMKSDSLLPYNTSFFLPGSVHHDPVGFLNDLKEYGVLENSHHRTMFKNDILDELGSYQSLRYFHNSEKPEVFSSVKNTVFSPHFLNLMNALNSFCFKSSGLCDKPLIPCRSSITRKTNVFSRTPTINLESNSDLPKTCNASIVDSKVQKKECSECYILPVIEKSDSTDKKCNMSASVKLNLKLTNRKTKQMNRRSRNRRRRQKKVMHESIVSSSSDDGDENSNDCNANLKYPISNSVSLVVGSPGFECSVSLQHTVQRPPLVSSFVVPVESDSNDSSDWESYDQTNNLNQKHCEVLWSESSPTSDSSESSVSESEAEQKTCGFSFVVPVVSSSDDDSDWDTCYTSTFTDFTEFEFTGLFVTNLCSFRPVPAVNDCKSETVESLRIAKQVLDANEKWNRLKDVKKRSASKITFAVDKDLVTVFQVEMFERKGEWETYATERLRFKRKIGELEKVLAPCLDFKHRSKIFKKLIEPYL